VGADEDIGRFRRLSRGTGERCTTLTVELGDFDSGRGVVDIDLIGETSEQKLGSFEIGIAPLYTGAFSFGAVWTKLASPAFGLVYNGTDSIVTQTDDAGSFRIKYAIFYTPFLMGARDIRKGGLNINPTLGSAYVTAGVHAGRVRRLNGESGVHIGDAFTGTSAEVPVQRRWRTDFFVGTSIDLRAAVQLFKVVLGAPTAGS
jgi:hypothetical protein